MKDPAQMNRSALNRACVNMWKKAKWGKLKPNLVIIIPNWLRVDKAMIFFASHSVVALKPAINIVVTATIKIIILKYSHLWRNG